MAQANASVAVTPGVGETIATHNPGDGKEYQVVMIADSSGHVQGSFPTYLYSSPSIATGASKLYLDIFNATGSGKVMMVRGIWLSGRLDIAVTGTFANRVDLYRTSAIGTGGSAATYDAATITATTTGDSGGGNFTKMDENNAAIPTGATGITARVMPTGGATISRNLFPMYVAGEEASTSMGYMNQFYNMLPDLNGFGQPLTVRENSGLLIKGGPTATAAGVSISVLIAFTLE